MKRKELLILGVLVLASLLYLLFSSKGDRIVYKLPQWENFKGEELQGVEFSSLEGPTTLLERQGEDWYLPGGKLADRSQVDRTLLALGGMKILDMVSEAGEGRRGEVYGLGEGQGQRIRLLFEDQREEKVLIFGKSMPNVGGTYFRFPDQSGIYTSSLKTGQLFPEDSEKLRDKGVLAFDPAALSSLTLAGPSQRLTLTKGEEEWLKGGEVFALSKELEKELTFLGSLNCESYLPEGPQGELRLSVELQEKEGKSHWLRVYGDLGEKGYEARSSKVEEAFLLTSRRVEALEDLLN